MSTGNHARTGHETRAHEVRDCPRCGEDHGEVTFHRMSEPIQAAGGDYRWWWLCEEAKAPVLADLSMEAA